MLHGVDTTFLVQAEVVDHPDHHRAKRLLDRILEAGDSLAIAPQVLAEFIHIVTDDRRFQRPLPIAGAIERAQLWWNAPEVVQVLPDAGATLLFLKWMKEHRLGRKRILDTQLAATYHKAGVRSILSSNARDYRVFGCFDILSAGSVA